MSLRTLKSVDRRREGADVREIFRVSGNACKRVRFGWCARERRNEKAVQLVITNTQR